MAEDFPGGPPSEFPPQDADPAAANVSSDPRSPEQIQAEALAAMKGLEQAFIDATSEEAWAGAYVTRSETTDAGMAAYMGLRSPDGTIDSILQVHTYEPEGTAAPKTAAHFADQMREDETMGPSAFAGGRYVTVDRPEGYHEGDEHWEFEDGSSVGLTKGKQYTYQTGVEKVTVQRTHDSVDENITEEELAELLRATNRIPTMLQVGDIRRGDVADGTPEEEPPQQ